MQEEELEQRKIDRRHQGMSNPESVGLIFDKLADMVIMLRLPLLDEDVLSLSSLLPVRNIGELIPISTSPVHFISKLSAPKSEDDFTA